MTPLVSSGNGAGQGEVGGLASPESWAASAAASAMLASGGGPTSEEEPSTGGGAASTSPASPRGPSCGVKSLPVSGGAAVDLAAVCDARIRRSNVDHRGVGRRRRHALPASGDASSRLFTSPSAESGASLALTVVPPQPAAESVDDDHRAEAATRSQPRSPPRRPNSAAGRAAHLALGRPLAMFTPATLSGAVGAKSESSRPTRCPNMAAMIGSTLAFCR